MTQISVATPCEATSFSSTINPPSSNSQIVCRRKDRGGCGASRLWSFSFNFS